MKIKPSSRNSNKHTSDGMALLESSINKVGVIESISIASDGTIISGHARNEIFEAKGMKPKMIKLAQGEYPVIQTDIKNNSKEYFEAQILANTTANKNFDLDIEMIEVIGEEFDIDIEEVGVDVVEFEENDNEQNENYQENKYPLSIVLNKANIIKWNRIKDDIGLLQDTNAFLKLMDNYKT